MLLIDRYEVHQLLGDGGTATVHAAWDRVLEVTRAVKIMNRALSRSGPMAERFLSEARAMARLEHPNVVRVLDVQQQQGQPFLVMELVEAGSLVDWVLDHGAMHPQQAVPLMCEVLRGIEAAHARGIIHRDVKPHNILIARDGTPKLSDFGIAQLAQHSLSTTRTGVIMGSPAYMAPEQRRSARQVDERSDVFATGATMLHLLTGEEPYDLNVSEAQEELYSDMCTPLALVLRKATRFQPEDRYPSATTMREALEKVIKHLPSAPTALPPLQATLSAERWKATGEALQKQSRSWAELQSGDITAPQPPPEYPGWGEEDTEPVYEDVPTTTATWKWLAGALAVLALVGAAMVWAPWENTRTGADEPGDREVLTSQDLGEIAAPSVPDENTAEDSSDVDPAPTDDIEEVATPREPEQLAAASTSPSPRTKRSQPAEPTPPRSAPPVEQPTSSESSSPWGTPAAPTTAGADEPGLVDVAINSRPWSTLKVDGDDVGHTLWKGQLNPGTYTLHMVTNDGRTRQVSWTVPTSGPARFCWDFALEAPCQR